MPTVPESGKNVRARVGAAQLLGDLYRAIADHTQVEQFLSAMDDFIEADPEGLKHHVSQPFWSFQSIHDQSLLD